MRWFLIDLLNGELVVRQEVGEDRPADAQPNGGDPFRPWYKDGEHCHTLEEDGVDGAHVYAKNVKDALARASKLLGMSN